MYFNETNTYFAAMGFAEDVNNAEMCTKDLYIGLAKRMLRNGNRLQKKKTNQKIFFIHTNL